MGLVGVVDGVGVVVVELYEYLVVFFDEGFGVGLVVVVVVGVVGEVVDGVVDEVDLVWVEVGGDGVVLVLLVVGFFVLVVVVVVVYC